MLYVCIIAVRKLLGGSCFGKFSVIPFATAELNHVESKGPDQFHPHRLRIPR